MLAFDFSPGADSPAISDPGYLKSPRPSPDEPGAARVSREGVGEEEGQKGLKCMATMSSHTLEARMRNSKNFLLPSSPEQFVNRLSSFPNQNQNDEKKVRFDPCKRQRPFVHCNVIPCICPPVFSARPVLLPAHVDDKEHVE